VLSGILYRLRTGCQWEAIPKEFGSGSTCYRRFRKWQHAGVFELMHREMLRYYDDKVGLEWDWIGSKLRDDGKGGGNRRRLEARAMLISETLADGQELRAAPLAVLGDCPPRLMPAKQPTREIPTVRAYYEGWIARRKTPLVRRSTVTRNRIAFENVRCSSRSIRPLACTSRSSN
jgi:hypothetical protein